MSTTKHWTIKPYGNRFEIQESIPGKPGGRRVAIFDRIEDARLVVAAKEYMEKGDDRK